MALNDFLMPLNIDSNENGMEEIALEVWVDDGRPLFFNDRSPFSTHDSIEVLNCRTYNAERKRLLANSPSAFWRNIHFGGTQSGGIGGYLR